MAVNPNLYEFTAEYIGDHPAYDGFDDYLRIEFAERHPGWEPRFGKATWFDRDHDRYNYLYLLRGSVPDAESKTDAENKVRRLLEEIERGLKAVRPKAEKPLPKPILKVWKKE